MTSAPAEQSCHATCLVLDEAGILIRGPSGAGKSRLCLDLLEEASARGRHARLVGDDRVRLSLRHGRLIGRPHPALAGLIEIRGVGLHRLPTHAEAAVIRLVVDLVEEWPRFPGGPPRAVEIMGVRLPARSLVRDQPREYLIREALAASRHESVSSQTQ